MKPALSLSKSLQSIFHEVLNTLTQCKYTTNAIMLQIKVYKVALGPRVVLCNYAMKVIFINMRINFGSRNTFMTEHILYSP